jgi:hypothetical protein
LHAFESFVGQTEKGFQVGFVRGHHLYSSHHKNSPKSEVTGIVATPNRLPSPMLQCSMRRIIGIKTATPTFFVAVQQKTNNRRCLPLGHCGPPLRSRGRAAGTIPRSAAFAASVQQGPQAEIGPLRGD